MKLNIPPVILASKSPRRQQLLQAMDIDFRVVFKDVDESYPDHLTPEKVALFIAEKKAEAFNELVDNEVVVTADTIVCIDQLILGKPESKEHAVAMLQMLSGRKHQVITGVCLLYKQQYDSFYEVSEVSFRELSEEQITHYVDQYQPFDKAGSYGIQEWIGLVAIENIVGSYTNIVGLPTEKLYQRLLKLQANPSFNE